MNERLRNLWVGLTALIALAGFCLMLTLFGPLLNLFNHGYAVRAEFVDANGLNIDSHVRLAGVDVGRVSDIAIQEPPRTGVVVTLNINKNRRLPANIHATIYAPPLGGTPWVGLEVSPPATQPGTQPAEQPGVTVNFLSMKGDAVITGEVSSMMGDLAQQLQNAMQEPMKKFDKLSNQFQKLSDEWVKVGQNVNQLLEPRGTEAVDNGKAVANVTTVMARADAAIKQARATLEGFDKWVQDPKLLADIKQTAANANQFTDRMNAGVGKFTGLADSARQSIDQLAKRYIAVADDLSGTVATLQKTIEQARTGSGTVGKLLNDPALYNNLNDAVERMNQAMKEFQLLAEKWKKEGLPVRF